MERRSTSGQLRTLPNAFESTPARTESAVNSSLKWLGDHQEENGSWSVTGYVNRCVGPEACLSSEGTDAFNVAVTGLSLLAFLGAGYSHLAKDEYERPGPGGKYHLLQYGSIVRDGIQYLMSQQDPSGVIGSPRYRRHLLNHLFATLALVESYGMTKAEQHQRPAQRAVLAAFQAQNSDGGWGDVDGVSDAFCTTWMLVLADSANRAGLSIEGPVLRRAERWLKERIDPATAEVGYRTRGTGGAVLAGEAAGSPTTLPALALLAAGNPDRFESWMTPAERLVASSLKSIDALDRYLRAAAMIHRTGSDGPDWKKRRDSFKEELVPTQHFDKGGCGSGSWDPADRWSKLGGRVYITAINTLSLELFYRYANALFLR
jgi:hypothetical protein